MGADCKNCESAVRVLGCHRLGEIDARGRKAGTSSLAQVQVVAEDQEEERDSIAVILARSCECDRVCNPAHLLYCAASASNTNLVEMARWIVEKRRADGAPRSKQGSQGPSGTQHVVAAPHQRLPDGSTRRRFAFMPWPCQNGLLSPGLRFVPSQTKRSEAFQV